MTHDIENLAKWDRRWLGLAEYFASFSKDPSTKCGAVIIRPDGRNVSGHGYNGFPRGMPDHPELYNDRNEKYSRIVHCEMNALLNTNEPVHGHTLYTWPFLTCDRCAVHVIQSGIVRVVAPIATPDQLERWGASFERTQKYYEESGVEWALL